ncbi:hypothetical protein ACQUWZ_27960, partial [Ralstonia pseudosolanacearum]|uniref:hypothetical protein n=1 Tax=Ralstonia pseudosolanacearum TaxID=1310165 RepID=UPI003D16851B
NGTSVAKNVNDPTDLSNAVKVQCLHDTPKGGGGIHLSQLGYIMLAQFTAQEINNLSNNRDKNAIVHFDLIGGNESFSNGKLYNHFGEQVATITSGGSISIFGNPTSLYGWFINQALYINSGVNGQIKIEFPANGRGRFCLAGLSKSTMSTNAVAGIIKLYADDTLV